MLGAAADAMNTVNIMNKAGLSRQRIYHLTLPICSFSGREKGLEQQFSKFLVLGPIHTLRTIKDSKSFYL